MERKNGAAHQDSRIRCMTLTARLLPSRLGGGVWYWNYMKRNYLNLVFDKDVRGGRVRPIKAQYANSSQANYSRGDGFGATGIIELYEKDRACDESSQRHWENRGGKSMAVTTHWNRKVINQDHETWCLELYEKDSILPNAVQGC